MDEKILRILAALPEVVREKVYILQSEADAHAGSAKRAHDQMLDAQRALQNARLRYQGEEDKRAPRMKQLERRKNPAMQAAAVALGEELGIFAAELEQFAAEHRRRKFAYEAARERFNITGNIWRRVVTFLEDLGPRLTPAEIPRAPLKKGEMYPGAVESIREDIARYKAEIDRTKSAPATTQEAAERARAYCRRLRDAAAPDVDVFYRVAEDGPVGWPDRQIFVHGVHGSRQTTSIRVPDVAAMFCWLFPDEFEAALVRTVEAAGDDEPEQLPLDRDDALRGLAADLEVLERKEETLITMAAAEGTTILRRVDCRVEIVLGVLLHHDILDAAA